MSVRLDQQDLATAATARIIGPASDSNCRAWVQKGRLRSSSSGLPEVGTMTFGCKKSWCVARVNAVRHGRGFDDELALLVVHGVLHVLGHDHGEPDETAVMQAREQALLRAHHRPATPSS